MHVIVGVHYVVHVTVGVQCVVYVVVGFHCVVYVVVECPLCNVRCSGVSNV